MILAYRDTQYIPQIFVDHVDSQQVPTTEINTDFTGSKVSDCN